MAIRRLVLEKKIFKIFTIYGRGGHTSRLEYIFVSANPEGYILNMVTIGFVASRRCFKLSNYDKS